MWWHVSLWISIALDISIVLVATVFISFFMFCCVMIVMYYDEIREGYEMESQRLVHISRLAHGRRVLFPTCTSTNRLVAKAA